MALRRGPRRCLHGKLGKPLLQKLEEGSFKKEKEGSQWEGSETMAEGC